MDAERALSRLETLLVEEREAIRGLDAERVVAAAVEKEQLFETLQVALPSRSDLGPRFRALVGELRHSGVLLAHARDCLRDAIAALQGEPARADGFGVVLRPGIRVNVTG